MQPTEISRCRICKSPDLITVVEMGNMALSGVFPKAHETVTSGPLSLVFCPESQLLQLKQSYNMDEMYGDNYGYRSGLNAGMVKHLRDKAAYLQTIKPLDAESTVIDIGGNDGTLLKAYEIEGLMKLLIDPTAMKWKEFYKDTDIIAIADFFPVNFYKSVGFHSPKHIVPDFSTLKADIITSIACFYDLEDPNAFVEAVAKHLKPEGIWHLEMSYLPSMLKANAYDTICHEHLEYYSLTVITQLLEKYRLKVIDVQLNDVNGGSIAVTAAHMGSSHKENDLAIMRTILSEPDSASEWMDEFDKFKSKMEDHRERLKTLIRFLKDEGHSVAGLGASTKGNILLQYCGFNEQDIDFISDVNPNKWECFTPGTDIPIVSESWARKLKPDYMLVLPWHFRDSIIQREMEYLKNGGRLIFPLPEIEIVSIDDVK